MKRFWIFGLLVAGIAVTAFGELTFDIGNGAPGAVGFVPNGNNFNVAIAINTNPAGSMGFGDTVHAVEVGRDDKGPFCAVAWTPGPNSPHFSNALNNHPCFGGLTLPAPTITLTGAFPPINTPIAPPGSTFPITTDPCSYNGIQDVHRVVYRPAWDPHHPGYGAGTFGTGSAQAGQVQQDLIACHAVANEIRAYLTSMAAGAGARAFPPNPGGGMVPVLIFEVDARPSTALNGAFLEGYKFKIISR